MKPRSARSSSQRRRKTSSELRALPEDGPDVDERLEGAGEAPPRVLGPLGDPRDLAVAGGQEGDDAVRLAEGAGPEDEGRGGELSMRGTGDADTRLPPNLDKQGSGSYSSARLPARQDRHSIMTTTTTPGDRRAAHRAEPRSRRGAHPRARGAVAAAREEARQSQDRWLRERADLENLKRRAARETAGRHPFATRGCIRDLLPVVDNLERARRRTPRAGAMASRWSRASTLVLKAFVDVLERHGVERVPRRAARCSTRAEHEAVAHVESADARAERRHGRAPGRLSAARSAAAAGHGDGCQGADPRATNLAKGQGVLNAPRKENTRECRKSSESTSERRTPASPSWKAATPSSSPTPRAAAPRRRWSPSPRAASGWSGQIATRQAITNPENTDLRHQAARSAVASTTPRCRRR